MLRFIIVILFSLLGLCSGSQAQNRAASFRVIAFYTAKNDKAHISFVREANA